MCAQRRLTKRRWPLQIEPNTTYKKYKESAHMSLTDHPISQPRLDISPISTSIITAEVKNYYSVQCRLSVETSVICAGTIESNGYRELFPEGKAAGA
jgi:hypothetical protein